VRLLPVKRQTFASQDAWPGAEQGGDNRFARTAVERQKAYAPSSEGACRSPQGCGGYGTASYGVPLPFFFRLFFVARIERSEIRDRH